MIVGREREGERMRSERGREREDISQSPYDRRDRDGQVWNISRLALHPTKKKIHLVNIEHKRMLKFIIRCHSYSVLLCPTSCSNWTKIS